VRVRHTHRTAGWARAGRVASGLVILGIVAAGPAAGCASGGTAAHAGPSATVAVPASPSVTLDQLSSAPSTRVTGPGANAPPGTDPQLRTVGPTENGTEVTVRVGTVLLVSPQSRAGGWQIERYPSAILRVTADAGPAARQGFVAYAVGEGQLTLTAVGSVGATVDSFTVHVRVLADLVR
jgi:hypothetical protein